MEWFQIGMLRKTVWLGLDIRPTKLNRTDRDAQRESNSRVTRETGVLPAMLKPVLF